MARPRDWGTDFRSMSREEYPACRRRLVMLASESLRRTTLVLAVVQLPVVSAEMDGDGAIPQFVLVLGYADEKMGL